MSCIDTEAHPCRGFATPEYIHAYTVLPMQVEEMYAPEINDFVYITDNAYSALEIRQMELRSLNVLYYNFSFV
jgi:hypothetical protein